MMNLGSEDGDGREEPFMSVEQEEADHMPQEMEGYQHNIEPLIFELNPLATEGTEGDTEQRVSDLKSLHSD